MHVIANQENQVSIWIIEDNEMLRNSLASVINQTDALTCPLTFSSCESAIDAMENGHTCDIMLLDIGLPGMSGIDGIPFLTNLSPSTQILVFTVHEDADNVFDAICAGASGYLLKPSSSEDVIKALYEIRKGGSPMNAQIARKVLTMFKQNTPPKQNYGLTRRETEVLQFLVDGFTQDKIAETVHVSPHTINTHIRNIYSKLHVHSRSSAVAKALRERIL